MNTRDFSIRLPLRMALIGCGTHAADSHAVSLAHYSREYPGRLRLIAACDIDRARAEAFCGRFGFEHAYADMESMLAENRPDACVCALPFPLMAEAGCQLLRLGIPCLLEKPPGANMTEGRRLVEVARRTGTPAMVSLNRRFMPLLVRARTWVAAQGPLAFIRGRMLRHSRRIRPDFVWATGIHVVDTVRYLAGSAVKTVRIFQPCRTVLSAPWFLVELGFENGAVGEVEIRPSAGWTAEAYELSGEGFCARFSTRVWKQTRLECCAEDHVALEEEAPADEPVFVTCGAYAETCAFFNALQEGRPMEPNLDDTLVSMRVCARLISSITT